ncbi:MAG: helix-turn-helix transcriptional regulator [Bacteroidales bacterium]|jgi:ribosome-binding protein aMBF1 (putative translation factor)
MRSKIADRILAKTPKDVEIFVRLHADITVRVKQLLKEKGYNQKQLAEKLDKSPSEINKWLKGDHNFTLKSIAKLQAELDDVILCVPK